MNHFLHPRHGLIMKDEDDNEEEAEEVICSMCHRAAKGPRYVCSQGCHFILHKQCANLPTSIRVAFHGNHQNLVLLKYFYQDVNCHICWKGMNGFGYSCAFARCKFQIHPECATSALCISNRESLEHHFLPMPVSISHKSLSYTCEACGLDTVEEDLNSDLVDGSRVPYMCTLCHILLHKDCLGLPAIIRIRQHPQHAIALTYCLGEQPREQKHEDEQENEEKEKEEEEEEEEEYIDKQSCGICSIKMDLNHGGYRCGDCGFVCHAKCTKGFIMIEKEEYEPVEPSFIVIREVQIGEGQTIVEEMKHFSHDHNLISFEDITQSQIGNNPKCECCALPIQTSFSSPPSCFGCRKAGCNFFMHTSCATLPRRKRILNEHSTLIKRDNISRCDICGEYCNGFVYCYTSHRYWCIQCSRLLQSDSIKHKGHRQVNGCHNSRIFLASGRGNGSFDCIACGGHHKTNSPFFTCASCNFCLDMKCAALPHKARPPANKYDDHDLFLTCRPLKSDSYQSYCLICEEERDPKLWFYYCRKCDFSAHVECVLGKCPRIKFDGSYELKYQHRHPLTLVQLKKGKDHPSCHHCQRLDFDLAVKCTTLECDYIMCARCSHYFP